MTLGSATGWPSSLNPMAPACASSHISASSFPLLPLVTQPMGSTLTVPSWRAFSRTKSTVARVSIVGSVLGMAQTVVNPPRAAAAVPVAMVSLYSKPGSRRWQ